MHYDDFENNIVFLDNHLMVLNKPAGILVQGDQTGDKSLLDISKQYLKQKFDKKGNVYLGLVQRIDRPVSGLVIFARTSKAAGRLCDSIRNHEIKKTYLALVKGKPDNKGTLIDYIDRNGATSIITDENSGKKAVLDYRLLDHKNNTSLIEVDLKTGRHHQIRLQFASRGFPILGDFRYGSKIRFGNKAIALHACSLAMQHPVKKEQIVFNSMPDTLYWFLDIDKMEIVLK